MKNTRWILNATLALVVLLLTATSSAEETADETVPDERWFTIEVIAFTQTPDAGLNETWPILLSDEPAQFAGQPRPDRPNDTNDTPQPEFAEVIAVDKNELQLSREAWSVNRARGYKVFAHQAWRQLGKDREHSPWIELISDNEEIGAKIRVSLARYLHVDVDMTVPNPQYPETMEQAESALETVAKTVHITSHRRMKSGELHYIDHPLAGLLVRIDKFQPEIQKNSDEATDTATVPAPVPEEKNQLSKKP